jgi:NAD-dependent deacetylase
MSAPRAGASATELDAARALLRAARRVAVLTGAGMSAESGVPTFRDALTGLWARFDPMELASREGFTADPARVWAWYAERRAGVLQAEPHAGHTALAQAQAALRFDRFALITQNVDGLHGRAGSTDVLELHGNILLTRCFNECGVRFEHPRHLPRGEPPRCPSCGAYLRPGVVWFGEMLDPAVLLRAEREVAASELLLVVGTSGLVYPAAGLPALGRAAGARVIVVNPNDSELDDLADVVVRSGACAALPALLAE